MVLSKSWLADIFFRDGKWLSNHCPPHQFSDQFAVA
jgi:hypothetical protein